MFDRFFGRYRRGWPFSLFEGEGYPAVDLLHEKDRIVARLELPGIDPKEVSISVVGRVLTVKGERKAEEEKEGEHYYAREISYGSFERSVTLPEGADTEKIKAVYKDGILEVSMPAKGIEKSRRIEIVTEEEPKKKAA